MTLPEASADVTLQELQAALPERGALVGFGRPGRFLDQREITVGKRLRTPEGKVGRTS